MANGRVIAVWGPPGAAGKSTVAVAIANELAEAGKSVVLLDFHFSAAALATMLGQNDNPGGIAAAARLVGQFRFTAEQLQRLTIAVPSGKHEFRLMTGLGAAERWPEISTDRAEEIINVAAENADYVVVDLESSLEANLRHSLTGLERHAVAAQVLSTADQIITVCSADPVGVSRYLKAVDRLIELGPRGQVLSLVNQLRTSVLGSSAKQQIVETLGRLGQITVDCFVPHDQSAADFALRSAVSITQAKRASPARSALVAFIKTQVLGERSKLDRRLAKLG